jgi:hypothetical protein
MDNGLCKALDKVVWFIAIIHLLTKAGAIEAAATMPAISQSTTFCNLDLVNMDPLMPFGRTLNRPCVAEATAACCLVRHSHSCFTYLAAGLGLTKRV